MYGSTERVERAKHAARKLLRKQEQRALQRLGGLCAVLALALAGTLAHFSGGAPGTVPGAYGATLLSASAGGYVLVGVTAFVTAAALTVACMRLHGREKRNRDGGQTKPKPPTADP